MAQKKSKVAPIPRGFRSITPHVTAPDVAGAVALYQSAFGATVTSTQTIPETDTVIFALVKIGNSLLTIGKGEVFGLGAVSLHLYVDDASATFDRAVEAGFTVISPLDEQYWGDLTGVLADSLGVRWSVGQRIVKLTAAEQGDRAKANMQEAVAKAQGASNDDNSTAAPVAEADTKTDAATH